MDTPTLAWKLFELLSLAALAGLTWLAVKAAQLLAVRVRSEHLARVLLLVDDVVLASARESQQVLVDQLKTASPDGDLTPDQGVQAKQAALDSAKSLLGPRGLADVATAFGLQGGAVDRLLAIRIEAAVYRLKMAARPASDPGTAGDAVPFAA